MNNPISTTNQKFLLILSIRTSSSFCSGETETNEPLLFGATRQTDTRHRSCRNVEDPASLRCTQGKVHGEGIMHRTYVPFFSLSRIFLTGTQPIAASQSEPSCDSSNDLETIPATRDPERRFSGGFPSANPAPPSKGLYEQGLKILNSSMILPAADTQVRKTMMPPRMSQNHGDT